MDLLINLLQFILIKSFLKYNVIKTFLKKILRMHEEPLYDTCNSECLYSSLVSCFKSMSLDYTQGFTGFLQKVVIFTVSLKLPIQESPWQSLQQILHGGHSSAFPIGIYLLKINNRKSGTMCEICSKLTTPLASFWCLYC